MVRPGIEMLLADSSHLVRGRRVGLLTNQTGIGRSGVADVELLIDRGVELVAIFSPEHGFRGTLDVENIGHATDSATGLPVYSLYGAQRAPTPEMLAEIDVMLVDLQDIGARPYTYISTTLLAMQAAAQMDLSVVVLDRPNPIGGEIMQGPVLDTSFASFVGMLPVPQRHGLTIGELARFGNERLGINATLTVVPVSGLRRTHWFDATHLPWVRPSPNMPSLESATHYPGLVLFEGTNLSVGRGTPIAFQVVGAPWLEAAQLAALMGAEPGVSTSDTVITPRAPGDGKHPDRAIPALRFRVEDRDTYDPVRLAVRLLTGLQKLHPDSFAISKPDYFDRRAGSDRLRVAVLAGESPDEIWRSWQEPLVEFRQAVEKHRLYR